MILVFFSLIRSLKRVPEDAVTLSYLEKKGPVDTIA